MKDLERKIQRAFGEEREKPMRLYFEFDSVETCKTAIDILNKLRDERKDYDETFRYFEGCGPDPKRMGGIEIRFSKNVPGLRSKFEALLSEQGIIPREEYETVAGEPKPEETKINGQNAATKMPNRTIRAILRRVAGWILITVGLIALLTPLTPGSWLIFVGAGLLGLRFLSWDRIKKSITKQ